MSDGQWVSDLSWSVGRLVTAGQSIDQPVTSVSQTISEWVSQSVSYSASYVSCAKWSTLYSGVSCACGSAIVFCATGGASAAQMLRIQVFRVFALSGRVTGSRCFEGGCHVFSQVIGVCCLKNDCVCLYALSALCNSSVSVWYFSTV
jgi:hypothetical protein